MDTAGQFTFLRSNCLPEIEFFSAIRNTALFSVFHERYEICLCRRGSTRGRYRGRPVQIAGHGVYLLEPGEIHLMTRVDEPQDFSVLFVAPQLLQRAAEEHHLRGAVHFPVNQTLAQDPPLCRILEQLMGAVQAGAPALEQQTWLAICLWGMLQHSERKFTAPRGTHASAAVRQSMAFLREHYQEPVDLDGLAALTGLSGYYLVHAFREQTGLPPHAFLTRIRVERARSLLTLGLPPAVVAAEVGFADQSHLNRHFKQAWHLTPGQYAARSPRDTVMSTGPGKSPHPSWAGASIGSGDRD